MSSREQPRRGLAVAAGAVSLSAIGGAIGFLGGGIDMGDALMHRLPLESPVLAGVALASWVAVPFGILTFAAWRGSDRTDRLAMSAGALLVAWLVVQLAFIRTISFFHPLYGAIGVAFVWAGWRHSARDQLPAIEGRSALPQEAPPAR